MMRKLPLIVPLHPDDSGHHQRNLLAVFPAKVDDSMGTRRPNT